MSLKSGLRLILASSEAVPFCKTGGLADVAGSLSVYLQDEVDQLALFVPYYRAIAKDKNIKTEAIAGDFIVPVAGRQEKVSLRRAVIPGPNGSQGWAYFVDHPGYFDRDGLYQVKGQDHPDNAERFILFARAVIEGAKYIGFKPDVIHCHDWQSALIPVYLKTAYLVDAYFRKTASVLTIHNIAYQGFFPPKILETAGLPQEEFRMEKLEFYGSVNFLKGGLVYADILNTVSPTYAGEIQSSPEFGRGLEGVLKARAGDLFGVLNGIDTKIWDPKTDPHLPVNYNGSKDPGRYLEAKAKCKAKLQKMLGLSPSIKTPLLGMVGRLDTQKGIDLAVGAFEKLLKQRDIQVAILGVGDPNYQKILIAMNEKYPNKFSATFEFSEPLAHLIYAAGDFFLMPSRFEPCGLSQMIAMRYGTLPIVTKTGGLADTVTSEKGFVCLDFTVPAFTSAVEQALRVHNDPSARHKLMAKAIATDFSWNVSVKRYIELYEKALKKQLV
ncbi:MAG: glycogen synthase [Elusimicrobia bacterium]|nr:glycogen synthase [Elusimicrobiota bacterium]